MFRRAFALFFVFAVLGAALSPADEIFLRYGKEEKDAKGKITVTKSVRGKIDPDKNTSPAKVVYSITGGDREIGVLNVAGISYDREESAFAAIRGAIEAGNSADAVADFQRLEAQVKAGEATFASPGIEAEYDFFAAYLPAMQLLEGSANPAPNAVAAKLNAFITKYPTNYRYYQACETMGLLSAFFPGDKLENARRFFGRLAIDKDSKEVQYRGKLLMARAMIREKKYPEAAALLTPMIAETTSDNRVMSGQIAQAKIALAEATAKTGKPDEAVKALQAVVDETPGNDFESHARANIALGNIQLEQKNLEEALLSFLKVDLIFFQYPELRAEALSKLGNLWTAIPNPRPDRAAEYKEKLSTMYPNSVWK